jgi:hypothetical protein
MITSFIIHYPEPKKTAREIVNNQVKELFDRARLPAFDSVAKLFLARTM